MEGESRFRAETKAGSRRGHRSLCLEEKRGHRVSQEEGELSDPCNHYTQETSEST